MSVRGRWGACSATCQHQRPSTAARTRADPPPRLPCTSPSHAQLGSWGRPINIGIPCQGLVCQWQSYAFNVSPGRLPRLPLGDE